MSLPNTFAAVTAATGAQLDANFNADGKLGTIPCTVSGTNALTLTPTAGISPTIAAYSNYLRFSGIVVNSNTGAMTLAVGSLAALNCYKDSVTGPVALSGGELIIGNAFTAIYDSALNTGAGGFHIWYGTQPVGGTISGASAQISLINGSVGMTLTSALLTGNSVSINAAQLQVGSSTASVTRINSGLGSVTFTVTPANSSQDQNIVVSGAQIRDVIALGLGTSTPAGAGFTGFCGTLGTVTVRMLTPTTVTLGAAPLTVRAMAMGLTP